MDPTILRSRHEVESVFTRHRLPVTGDGVRFRDFGALLKSFHLESALSDGISRAFATCCATLEFGMIDLLRHKNYKPSSEVICLLHRLAYASFARDCTRS